MKADIHPKSRLVNAQCACGASYEALTTAPELKVTICSNCHPFFTGQQKHVDTGGRISRFEKKYKKK